MIQGSETFLKIQFRYTLDVSFPDEEVLMLQSRDRFTHGFATACEGEDDRGGGGLTRGQKVKEPTTSILLDLCSWIHGNLFRLFEILMRCFRIFRGIVGQTDRMILQSLFQFLEMIQRFVHDDLWMMIYLLKIWIPGRGDFLTRLKILNKLLKNNSITILLSSEKS